MKPIRRTLLLQNWAWGPYWKVKETLDKVNTSSSRFPLKQVTVYYLERKEKLPPGIYFYKNNVTWYISESVNRE